jgi:hypothetical protein
MGVNATTVNWETPSFAVLKVELLLCRLDSSWDHECQIRRSDAQHALDAVWSCLKEQTPARRCTQVKREFFSQGSALLESAEVAGLPGHRPIPFAASNPWLADSIQQWMSPSLWSDPHIGFLLVAALAFATNIASNAYGRRSAYNARISLSADRLLGLRRRLNSLPSEIRSEQETVDWFNEFFKVIDLGLSLLPNSKIPLSVAEFDVAKPESATTAALDAVLGADSFRGKGRARPTSKCAQPPAPVWIDRTVRRDDHRLVNEEMIIDFVVVPITMRIKLKFMWLGNPGCMSRYQWTVEAMFRDVDERLVRTCPNQYGTKCLTWCTEFDFKAWDGDGEAEGRSRAMAWLANALQRKVLVSEGSAATRPYAKSVDRLDWLRRQLAELPQIIQAAGTELDQLQAHGSLRCAIGLRYVPARRTQSAS